MKQAPLAVPPGKMLNDKDYDPRYSHADTYKYESIDMEEFIVDRENKWKQHMYEQERIGRYPQGFRHFENFANYSQFKKDATIQEYMETMNRPCEFAEYLQIMRQHLKEESESPHAELEERQAILEHIEEEIEPENLDDMVRFENMSL